MAVLPILEYPDPRLHTVATPVIAFDEAIKRLIKDMAETMYAAPGIGLAATQVDVHQQLIVIDVSSTKDKLLVFINPAIVHREGEIECEEGCLSVPGYYDKVTRAEKIRVEALNAEGQGFSLDAEALLAVCIQHEIDHLQGKVFVEYLSPLKRSRLKNRIKKRQREEAPGRLTL